MSEKLLKTGGKRKVAAKRAVATSPAGIVVVGNYKTGQLDWIKKNGVYNWPVREEDGHAGRMTLPADAQGCLVGRMTLPADAQGRGERPARPIQPDDLAKVNELWLYANAKSERHVFSAEFVGKMTAAEFRAAYPTYAKLGASKQKAYYVFKTTPVDYPPELGGQIVLARTAVQQDFYCSMFAQLENAQPREEKMVVSMFSGALGLDNSIKYGLEAA